MASDTEAASPSPARKSDETLSVQSESVLPLGVGLQSEETKLPEEERKAGNGASPDEVPENIAERTKETGERDQVGEKPSREPPSVEQGPVGWRQPEASASGENTSADAQASP